MHDTRQTLLEVSSQSASQVNILVAASALDKVIATLSFNVSLKYNLSLDYYSKSGMRYLIMD